MRRATTPFALVLCCALALAAPAASHPGHGYVVSPADATQVLSARSAFTAPATPFISTADDGCGSVQTGRVFVTGHDADFHANAASGGNLGGARHILQRAVAYVTAAAPDPSLLLVTSTSSTGAGTLDPRVGLTEAGLSFDVAHAGDAGAGVLDLDGVDFSAYDAVIIASDFGGWLSQAEVDALNARSSALASYIGGGGGVVALSESVVTDAYGFLPFLVSHVPENAHEDTLGLTAFGGELGLVSDDVNGNFYHSYFSDGGVLQPVDLDTMGTEDEVDDHIISLAGRLCSTLTVVKQVVNNDGGQALPSSFSLHVRSNGSDIAGSPQAGSSTGTTYALAPGAYSVGEDASPAYTAAITGDCAGSGAITLTAGQDATCVVTNDDKPVDTQAPNLHISEPVHQTTISDSTPTYLGDAGTEPGDAGTVTVDIYAGINPGLSGPPVQTLSAPVSGSIWTVEGGPPLADGTYTVRASQRDSAGNFGSSNIPYFTIDTTAPAVTGIGAMKLPSGVDATGMFCDTRRKACKGLKISTTFTTSPGNAVWTFGAFRRKGTTAAAARMLRLGKLAKRITKNGTVKVAFKVKGTRARRLLKHVRKLKLNRLRTKLTYTPDGKSALVQTSIIKLRFSK